MAPSSGAMSLGHGSYHSQHDQSGVACDLNSSASPSQDYLSTRISSQELCEGLPPRFDNSTTCSLSGCQDPDQCSSRRCCDSADCLEDCCSEPWRATEDHIADPGDYSTLYDHSLQNPLSCQWLLPGQQCAVSPQSLDDLGDHVFQDHIQPQNQQLCHWNKCNDLVEPQQLVDHLSQYHHTDAYVCLWQDCESSFMSLEALDGHIKATHMQSFDCHWAGCEVANDDPKDLAVHVYQEHLHIKDLDQVPDIPSNISCQTLLDRANHSNILRQQIPDFQPKTSQLSTLPSQDAIELSIQPKSRVCQWIDERVDTCCGQSFVGAGNELQGHVERAHTKKKSVLDPKKGEGYYCRWHGCLRKGNAFRDRSSLNRHLYIHTGCTWKSLTEFINADCITVFFDKCQHCGKTFASKHHLENHLRMHEKTKPFQCEACHARLSNKESLSK